LGRRRNLTLDVRYPGDQYTRLQELANELVKLKVDVLATLGTPATLAAKHATTTIPIVMESLSDVVSIGLVANLAKPGGNLTGVSGFAPELSGKRLELIREILPQADRIAVLANRANPVAVPILRATESAAQQMRMKLYVIDVRQPSQLGAAFETVRRERADALVLVAALCSSVRGRRSFSWRLAIACRPYTRRGSSPMWGDFFRTGRWRKNDSNAWLCM
jgi:putative tryptophan/tyrosine transport system substrate-binding protein